MSFFMPTKVIYKEEAVLKHREIFQDLDEPILIITGKSSKKNGSLDDLLDVLERKRIYLYDDTPENPSLDIIKPLAEKFGDAEVVIGLGGGSPMDTAKAVAVLIENPNLGPEDLYSNEKYKRAKPIICIPTTAGTGSEVTQYSVLTFNGRKKGFSHECIFPKYAFVDYRYTLTLGKEITLSTGLDALSHALEGFLSLKSTPFSDLLALEAMKIIKDCFPKLLDDPENVFYRERMMFASTVAGMVISQTGTTIAHALGYNLTTEKSVRHGLATAVFLPFELRQARKVAKEKVETVLKIFEGSLEDYYWLLGISLDINISEEEIERWTKIVSISSHINSTPGSYSSENLKEAYEEIKDKYCKIP